MHSTCDLLGLELPTVREEEAIEMLSEFERLTERAAEIEGDLIDTRQKLTTARNRLLERLGVRA